MSTAWCHGPSWCSCRLRKTHFLMWTGTPCSTVSPCSMFSEARQIGENQAAVRNNEIIPTSKIMDEKRFPNEFWTPRSHRRLEIVERDCPSRVKLFEAVYAQKHTRQQAIRAQSLDCQGLDRVGVAECGDRLCPLWHHRPYAK